MFMRVYAMARPRRPMGEAALVRAAADASGSALERARRVATLVTAAAMQDVDREPEAEIIGLLLTLNPNPILSLATDPEIDTAALIRDERAHRTACRGGRRLREREWPSEDRAVAQVVADKLAERYRRHLAK